MSEYDPLDLRGQQSARSKRELANKLTNETEESDIRWLMSRRQGRRIAWRLLEQAGVFRLSFNTNAMQMAFNEGNRNFGNRTLALINTVCPELYMVMAKENTDDHRSSDDNGPNTN
jgi:hypothetical protein